MSDVITAARAQVEDESVRRLIYEPIVESLEESYWDTMDECVGEEDAYDAIYAERYGDDE